jgi:hypothetical protein
MCVLCYYNKKKSGEGKEREKKVTRNIRQRTVRDNARATAASLSECVMCRR